MNSSQGRRSGGSGPAAAFDAAGALLLDDLLRARTGTKYSYVEGKFRLSAAGGGEVIHCRDLGDPALFSRVIDRYAAKYGGADRRAVVSMWTMYYFSTLGIGAALFWLELRRRLPLSLGETELCLDADTGEPQGFVLSHAGEELPGLPIEEGMGSFLFGHCEPLIQAISANEGVSKRLIWSNAAAYLAWIVGEIGRLTNPGLAEEGRALLDNPVWRSGRQNSLAGLIRDTAPEGGEPCARRRVCCLRYVLPGVAGCGMTCPLPQGRD